MVQPIEVLFMGLIPAFAAVIIQQDIKKYMISEKETVQIIHDLNKRRRAGQALLSGLSYSTLPFELSHSGHRLRVQAYLVTV